MYALVMPFNSSCSVKVYMHTHEENVTTLASINYIFFIFHAMSKNGLSMLYKYETVIKIIINQRKLISTNSMCNALIKPDNQETIFHRHTENCIT